MDKTNDYYISGDADSVSGCKTDSCKGDSGGGLIASRSSFKIIFLRYNHTELCVRLK